MVLILRNTYGLTYVVTVNRVKIIKTVLVTVALKLHCLHILVMTITVNQLDVFQHWPWPNDIFSDELWEGQNCPGNEANYCLLHFSQNALVLEDAK